MHVLGVLDAELREASSLSRRKASDSKPFQESMHPGYQARLRYDWLHGEAACRRQ